MSTSSRKVPLRWINTSQSQDQTTKNSEVYSHVTSRYRRWARSNRLLVQLKRSTTRILRGPKQKFDDPNPTTQEESMPQTELDTSLWTPYPDKTISDQQITIDIDESKAMQEQYPPPYTTTRDLILPPKLAHGNSDPFSAASISMTAQVNELLYLGIYRFVVFSCRAYYLSSKLRDRWMGQSQKQHRQSISCAALTHILIASGYCARAAMSKTDRGPMLTQARMHKIEAIRVFRHQMNEANFNPSMNTYHVMTNLASVDFAMGEPESAMIHHRAVTSMVKRPEFHDAIYMKGTLGDMAEVNIIRALAVQPNFDAKDWGIDISSTGIDDTSWYDPVKSLDVQLPPLRFIFDECQVLMQMKRGLSNDSEETAYTLTHMSLNLEKRLVLLSIYYRNLADDGFLLGCKKILVSITHALLWFLDVIFVESMYRGYPHGLFEPYRLNVLFLECPLFKSQPVQKDLYLWLVFISIASEILSSRSNLDSPSTTLRDHLSLFHKLRLENAVHYSREMMKCSFSKYLFHDETMDPILDNIWPSWEHVDSSEQHKSLTTWM